MYFVVAKLVVKSTLKFTQNAQRLKYVTKVSYKERLNDELSTTII